MASASKQTSIVRERKARSRGKAAKNARANKGSTVSREELFKVRG